MNETNEGVNSNHFSVPTSRTDTITMSSIEKYIVRSLTISYAGYFLMIFVNVCRVLFSLKHLIVIATDGPFTMLRRPWRKAGRGMDGLPQLREGFVSHWIATGGGFDYTCCLSQSYFSCRRRPPTNFWFDLQPSLMQFAHPEHNGSCKC